MTLKSFFPRMQVGVNIYKANLVEKFESNRDDYSMIEEAGLIMPPINVSYYVKLLRIGEVINSSRPSQPS